MTDGRTGADEQKLAQKTQPSLVKIRSLASPSVLTEAVNFVIDFNYELSKLLLRYLEAVEFNATWMESIYILGRSLPLATLL